MTNSISMNKGQFSYWQNKMGLSDEATAENLNTTVFTIRGYRTGGFSIPQSVAQVCRWLEKEDVLRKAALYLIRLN